MSNPFRLIMIAFALLIIGVAVPFLMVIGILTSTLPLNMVAYSCSLAGLVVGFIGIAQYRRRPKQ
jgi:membrane associated rhomboid family serine protease